MNHDFSIGAAPWSPVFEYDRIMSYARRHKAIIPTLGTDTHRMLEAMMDGHKITVLTGPKICGLCSVTQRAGDLIRYGWPVKKEWKVLKSGKRVKEYSL